MKISRREFVSGAAAIGMLGRSGWASPLGLPLGIQLYSVREQMAADLDDAFSAELLSTEEMRRSVPAFDELAEQIPLYRERHMVKAGLTGWAQVNYPYGASVDDARSKLSYDLYYVKNFSILFDFVILLQTLRVVLWPSGVR